LAHQSQREFSSIVLAS